MATVRKFQFDVEFDAAAHAPAPAREADPPPPPQPSFSEQEIAAAREAAFQDGRAAGAAEAAAAAEAMAAAALTALGAALDAARPALDAMIERCRGEALTLAATVARKLVPSMLARDAVAAVESVVTDLLPQVIDEPRLVIRANDALIDTLKRSVEALAARAGYGGRIILLGDERLSGAECRIEWADGGAEHDIERLSREIAATVDRFLHGVGGDAPDAADTADTTMTPDPQETIDG
ncbi:MAG TPA: FliH/SctL family protein [Candidatus Limnocylindria bacterium]|nr:FliH/SctL family protein [Candidatus Limnocylindria bacterium]